MGSEQSAAGHWKCDACGQSAPGERGAPPLNHVRECEAAGPDDLVFVAE
jgi:hypothetical protein